MCLFAFYGNNVPNKINNAGQKIFNKINNAGQKIFNKQKPNLQATRFLNKGRFSLIF